MWFFFITFYINKTLKGPIINLKFLIYFVTLLETIGIIYLKTNGIPAKSIFLFYEPFVYYFLILYFLKIIKNQNVRLVLRPTKLIFPIILFVINFSNFYFVKVILDTFLVTAIIFSLLSLFYFYQLLTIDIELELINNPNYWIVLGIFIFHTCSFFVMGLIQYINRFDNPLAKKLFSINHILNIIYYSLITYGFICQRRLAKSSL